MAHQPWAPGVPGYCIVHSIRSGGCWGQRMDHGTEEHVLFNRALRLTSGCIACSISRVSTYNQSIELASFNPLHSPCSLAPVAVVPPSVLSSLFSGVQSLNSRRLSTSPSLCLLCSPACRYPPAPRLRCPYAKDPSMSKPMSWLMLTQLNSSFHDLSFWTLRNSL